MKTLILTTLLSIALMLVGGCVENSPQESSSNVAVPPNNAGVSDAAYQVVEYHWGSGEQTEVATRLSFRFDQLTSCEWRLAVAAGQAEPALNAVVVLRSDTEDAWSAYTVSGLIHAQAASQEVPTLGFAPLLYHDRDSHFFEAEEFLTVDFFGKGLRPERAQFSPGHAMAFSLYCDQPFVVEPIWAGDEVSLIDAHALNGTAVDALYQAQAIVDGRFQQNVVSDRAGFWMAYGSNFTPNIDFGTAELNSPAGFDSWLWSWIDVSTLVHIAAGPGIYDLRVRRVAAAAPVGFWWSVIYGHSEQIPPDQAGLPATAIVD
ncbi:MAG: hypothetical protein ACPHCJ_06450 [Oceanococcaceae bacterium]